MRGRPDIPSFHLGFALAVGLAALCPAQGRWWFGTRDERGEVFDRVAEWLGETQAKPLKPVIPLWLRQLAERSVGSVGTSSLAKEIRELLDSWENMSYFERSDEEVHVFGRLALLLWRADDLALKPDCPLQLLVQLERAYYTANNLARIMTTPSGAALRDGLIRALAKSKGKALSPWDVDQLPMLLKQVSERLYYLQLHAARAVLKDKSARSHGCRVLRNMTHLFWEEEHFQQGLWVMQVLIRADPGNIDRDDWMQLCRLYAATEDVTGAKRAFARAKNSKEHGNERQPAYQAFRLRRLEEVVKAARLMLTPPESYEDRMKHASALLALSRVREATDAFRALLKENEADARPRTGLGLCAVRDGEYRSARKFFAAALVRKPHGNAFFELQLRVLLQEASMGLPRDKDDAHHQVRRLTRRTNQALEHLRPRWGKDGVAFAEFVLGEHNRTIAAWLAGGDAGFQRAMDESAGEAIAYRNAHPNILDAYKLALQATLFLADRAAARRAVTAPLPPDHQLSPDFASDRAEVYFLLLDNTQDPGFRQGLDVVLKDLPAASGFRPLILGNYHAVMARHSGEEKAWLAAQALYRKVLSGGHQKLHAQAWNNLGVVLVELGDRKGGIRAFDRSLALYPTATEIVELNQLLVTRGTVSAGAIIQKLKEHVDEARRPGVGHLAWLVHLAQQETNKTLARDSSRKLLTRLGGQWHLRDFLLGGHGVALKGGVSWGVYVKEGGWPLVQAECQASVWLQWMPPLTLADLNKIADSK